MSRRKTIVAGVAACLVATLAFGLPGATAKSNEVVTLHLLWPVSQQQAMDIIVANFGRVYPNIKIEPQYLAPPDIETLLLTQMQAGNAPDLFFVKAARLRSNGVWPMAEAGTLLDLTGRKWQNRIYPPVKLLSMWNNKVYAWPTAVIPYGILYNVALFNQLGLKLPTKFSDVLALCRQINAAGKIPFIQGFRDSGTALTVAHILASNNVWSVDLNWSDKRAKKQITFASSPLWRTVLQSVLDMKDAGCFQPGSAGSGAAQTYAPMARGDAVMTMVAGPALPNIVAVNPNVQLKMINLPPADPKNARLTLTAAALIGANARTKYPAQARTFIDFLAREQQSALFARLTGSLSTLQVKKDQLLDYMKPGLTPFFKSGKYVEAVEAGWPSAAVNEQGLVSGIQGLITGQLTVEQVLANMDRLWDAAG